MRAAAIDVGTNSIRLLVAEALEHGGLRWLDHRVTVTRLGQDVDRLDTLSEEAIARTLGVLESYAAALRSWRPDGVRAVATSAVRDASNRDAFLDRAEAVLGFRPVVIDGESEAVLSFKGATSGLRGNPPFLVIDPGGGSTEFVMGSEEPEVLVSIDIGSVRLTERLLPERPAAFGDVVAASAEVDRLFEQVELPGEPGLVVGVGGTFTSLAAIALDLPDYDRLQVHGATLTRTGLGELVGELSEKTVEETAAIPSLDPARAPVILAGAVVAEAALRRSGRDRVTVSESDILDGIALELTGA